LQDAGEDRIAGKMSRIITVTSKDMFRYGYRFWIDTSNYMLLKFDLTDPDGKAIEQVMFTRLSVDTPIPATAFQPSLTGDGYNWYRQDVKANPAVDPDAPGWVVNRLPAGFELAHFQHKRMRQDGEEAEHMVFSDGLASLSVYVEKLMEKDTAFSGLSSMGAMNAFGAVVDGHQVTVVGEVPLATVQMVAVSVSQQGSGSD
jgi:sigma-E factor negative regulatory protein RseB